MSKAFLDEDSPFTQALLRDTAIAAKLPDVQTARTMLAAYEPRDASEAILASHVVAQRALLAEFSRRAAEPGRSAADRASCADAVARLGQSIRAAQTKLGPRPAAPAPVEAPMTAEPLDERLKVHFFDGGNSIH
jgi:hypothetical protein